MSTNNIKQSQMDAFHLNQIVTIKDLNRLKEELLSEIAKLLTTKMNQPPKKWLKSKEVRNLLNISPGTLQNLRISGTLSFTRVGGAIYYCSEDIDKMLNGGSANQ